MPDGGASIVLLDDIHFDGVAILSYVTFQLGGTGFPCNNGAFRVICELKQNKKKGIIKENVLTEIRRMLFIILSSGCELTHTQKTPEVSTCHTQVLLAFETPNFHFYLCQNGDRVEKIPPPPRKSQSNQHFAAFVGRILWNSWQTPRISVAAPVGQEHPWKGAGASHRPRAALGICSGM